MATAHLSVKVGKVGKATPHAEYIAREGKYSERLTREKLEATESGNMPAWAEKDPMKFWQAADTYERKNGYVYREHEIALPREISAEQRAELVRKWVAQELGDKHAYTWAIHNKTALDGGEQPHLHLMYSERTNDGIERDPEQYFKRYNSKHPERGGARKATQQGTQSERAAELKALRERWEHMYNAHSAEKISMKSLAERGIDRTAAPHMTPSESAAAQRRAAAEREAQAATRVAQAERTEAAVSMFDLVQQYQQRLATAYGKDRKSIEAAAKRSDYYKQQEQRIAAMRADIERTKHERAALERKYKQEQERRKNSWFGLGAMLRNKESAEQQAMQEDYKSKGLQLAHSEKALKEAQEEQARYIKEQAEKAQRAAMRDVEQIAAQISAQPLAVYRDAFERVAHGAKASEQQRAEVAADVASKRGEPLQQRLAYLQAASSIISKQQQEQARAQAPERQRAQNNKNKDKDRGGIER